MTSGGQDILEKEHYLCARNKERRELCRVAMQASFCGLI